MKEKILQSSNPYEISFPDVDMDKINNDFNEKLKLSIKEMLKKAIESVREDIELEYYANYSSNLEHYLNDLALDKAKALVEGLLNGEDQALRTFLKFGYSRPRVLEAVIDYASKIEIEELRIENKSLRQSLDFIRN